MRSISLFPPLLFLGTCYCLYSSPIFKKSWASFGVTMELISDWKQSMSVTFFSTSILKKALCCPLLYFSLI